MENQNSHIILFDGVCNLCNSTVQFIIKHDRNGKFYFASLQSEFGQEQVKKYKIDPRLTDSVIYIYNDCAYIKSSAALRIARQLDRGWPLLFVFMFLPPFIRNFVYDFIAKNRYKWFGKKDSCMIPSPELKGRFLG
jgi:predicted DCC family thiol-disulfide oxidoreductase YuxK